MLLMTTTRTKMTRANTKDAFFLNKEMPSSFSWFPPVDLYFYRYQPTPENPPISGKRVFSLEPGGFIPGHKPVINAYVEE